MTEHDEHKCEHCQLSAALREADLRIYRLEQALLSIAYEAPQPQAVLNALAVLRENDPNVRLYAHLQQP